MKFYRKQEGFCTNRACGRKMRHE